MFSKQSNINYNNLPQILIFSKKVLSQQSNIDYNNSPFLQ